jgi:hypothetical protein
MGADLIVMGTHGRAGTSAFWAGSIAPRVCSRTRLPLLLVPVTESVDSYSENLAKDMQVQQQLGGDNV